ncbi:MAG TPA: hypothetical protein VLF39_03095, partial [Candidatus Saccharimonadales bacterium]|nr:hypothetical protein [Candidatus Saccharimonadales bacterium]
MNALNRVGSKRGVAMTVKIVGHGWVGKAMKTMFPEAFVHDPEQGLVNNKKTDICFICVPTPNNDKAKLDVSIVEEAVKNSRADLIVIRSTVNPGDTDRLKKKTGKRIVFQPEYLGETPNHPMIDPTERQFLIIGGDQEDRRKLIELYHEVYNANVSIRQTSALEAEIIKLSENRAIAFKVAQCQELYDACEAAGVDYHTIRDAVYGDDPRFTLWWTFVFPENRGFNSKCIPKDVHAWADW